MKNRQSTKYSKRGLEPLIEFFRRVNTHEHNDAKKEMTDFITLIQKDAKKASYLEERIVILYDKVLKDDYIDIMKYYYSLKHIKTKGNEKSKLCLMIEELMKALKQHETEYLTNRKIIDMMDKTYINMLGELNHILNTKKGLAELYNEILIYGNKQEYVSKLNKINGYFKIGVTMDELKEVKESTELEIEALLAIFGCLEAVSEYDHIMAIAKLYKLKTVFEGYAAKFLIKNKNYLKAFLWQWIKYTWNVFEAKIAFYFNPFFISQAALIESVEEETKLSNIPKRNDFIILDKKFNLFDKVRDFCSDFLCRVFILLDKSVLKLQPTLIFNNETEAMWQLHKGTDLMKIYDYTKDDKFVTDITVLTKLSSLINAANMKLHLDDNAEPIEDSIKDKFRFFIIPIDTATSLSVIGADIYSKKKYNDKIKKAMKMLVFELRSYNIINKLRELSSSN